MGKQKGYVVIEKTAEMPANHTPILYGIMTVRPAGVWIRTEAGTVNQRRDTL